MRKTRVRISTCVIHGVTPLSVIVDIINPSWNSFLLVKLELDSRKRNVDIKWRDIVKEASVRLCENV